MKGNGRYYQGKVNVTKGGLACQTWYTDTPHKHSSPPEVFPEMLNSSNYCRNGGGIEISPWCYTMDPLVRWQHCDIEQCGEFYLDIQSQKLLHLLRTSNLQSFKSFIRN